MSGTNRSHVGWATAFRCPTLSTDKIKIPRNRPNAIHTLQRKNVGHEQHVPDLPGYAVSLAKQNYFHVLSESALDK